MSSGKYWKVKALLPHHRVLVNRLEPKTMEPTDEEQTWNRESLYLDSYVLQPKMKEG
jgi:hypothetical protein